MSPSLVPLCAQIKFHGAYALSTRRLLDGVAAVGSSLLHGASTAASSPRNDLVKNYRVHTDAWMETPLRGEGVRRRRRDGGTVAPVLVVNLTWMGPRGFSQLVPFDARWPSAAARTESIVRRRRLLQGRPDVRGRLPLR